MKIEDQIVGAIEYAQLQARGNCESLCGVGSTERNTRTASRWIMETVQSLRFRSVGDIPCGDINWIRHLDLPNYHGYDVLATALDMARMIRPDWHFSNHNAITDPPRRHDLLICRDLLVHLTLEHASRVIANLRASGSTWLMATTFPVAVNEELAESHFGWGWRPLNLSIEPFNLRAVDSVDEDEGNGKSLALYKLNPS